MTYRLSILILLLQISTRVSSIDFYHKQTLGSLTNPIIDFTISRDQSLVIIAQSLTGTIQAFRKTADATGIVSYVPTFPAAFSIVDFISMDLNANAELLAVGLDSSVLNLYKVSQVLGLSINQSLSQASGRINVVKFSEDSSLLISGSLDQKLRIYTRVNEQYHISQIISGATGPIISICMSLNKKFIYSAESSGKVRIYTDTAIGYTLFQTITSPVGSQINSIAASDNSLTFVIGFDDGIVKIYKYSIYSGSSNNYIYWQKLNDTVDPIRSVSVNSDGTIITASTTSMTPEIKVYTSPNPFEIYKPIPQTYIGEINKILPNTMLLLGTETSNLHVYESCSVHANCDQCTNSAGCNICKDGYYSDALLVCQSCSTNCSSCVGSPSHCTKCIQGYYPNAAFICDACSIGCKTCIGTTTCSDCFDGYFRVGITCSPCAANCSKCTDAMSCISCSSTYYNSSGTCLPCPYPCNNCKNTTFCKGCASGYYLQSPTICQICQPPCITCTQLNSCDSCITGYYYTGANCAICPQYCLTCLNSSVCTTCNSSYTNVFHDGTTCIFCPYNCSACTNPSSCTSCEPGFYSSAGLCPKCPNNCENCTSSSVCNECFSGFALDSLNLCVKCPQNCYKCSDPGKCTSCLNGSFLQNFKCFQCTMVGCMYCSSESSCLRCEEGYSHINQKCLSFQTKNDPYAYVREIKITPNQTLSLIITIVLLIFIAGAAIVVYCWIRRSLNPESKEDDSPKQGNKSNVVQEMNKSEMHLVSNQTLP